MKIELLSYTQSPERAITAAMLNTGIGKDITDLSSITDEEVQSALSDIFKSHLDSPLEYASFNLFWKDIPLFLRAQLVRHRVGWGFCERSLRFFDANLLRESVENYDWEAMPSVKDSATKNPILNGMTVKDVVKREMSRQMDLYALLLEEGVDQQDARNIIGVFFPTAMQTTCTYRALRAMMADRLSSNAHPLWQKAAQQIKALVTEVSPLLGAGLVDSCEMRGKCVWVSKFDRECDSCVKRGWAKNHNHVWSKDTTMGRGTQCECGVLKERLLGSG